MWRLLGLSLKSQLDAACVPSGESLFPTISWKGEEDYVVCQHRMFFSIRASSFLDRCIVQSIFAQTESTPVAGQCQTLSYYICLPCQSPSWVELTDAVNLGHQEITTFTFEQGVWRIKSALKKIQIKVFMFPWLQTCQEKCLEVAGKRKLVL